MNLDEDFSENPEALLKNAEILLHAKDYKLARNIYKAVFLSGEKTAEALFGVGRCFESEQKWEEAVEAYEESVAYLPVLNVFERWIGIEIGRGKDQRAVQVIHRALRIAGLTNESKIELYQTMGNAHLRLNDDAAAIESFEHALDINPENDELVTNLGSVLLKQNRVQEALNLFDHASELNPKNPNAHMGRGTCHLTLGDKKRAHSAFAESLKVDIKNATALYYLIRCAFELSDFTTAENILSIYVKNSPVNADLLYTLAGLQYHCRKYTQCLRTIEKVLFLTPGHYAAIELQTLAKKFIQVKEDEWKAEKQQSLTT